VITVVIALRVVVFFVAPIFAIIPVISTFAAVITVLRANGRAHGSSESQEKQTGKKSLHDIVSRGCFNPGRESFSQEKAVRMIQLNGQVPPQFGINRQNCHPNVRGMSRIQHFSDPECAIGGGNLGTVRKASLFPA